MRVNKSDERLARALVAYDLYYVGFPQHLIQGRIDEAWPGQLKKAKDLNYVIKNTYNWELDGETTKKEMEKWAD